MERVNQILRHSLWRETMEQLGLLEQDRIFCRHDLSHLLDVARIACLENWESGLGIPKELIYAGALLHDLGRAAQYREGTPHHQASAQLAQEILPACGFSPAETAQILSAIRSHREDGTGEDRSLSGLLYRADKASRMCMFCGAREGCNWSDEKKNFLLKR